MLCPCLCSCGRVPTNTSSINEQQSQALWLFVHAGINVFINDGDREPDYAIKVRGGDAPHVWSYVITCS